VDLDTDDIQDESGLWSKWLSTLEKAEKRYTDYWKQCETARKITFDRDKDGKQRDITKSRNRYNITWAHFNTWQPAIYSQEPKPVGSRRNLDKDPPARVACEIYERAVTVNNELCEMDERLRTLRDDYLLFSQAVPWVRYEADTEIVIGPDGLPQQQTTNERVEVDRIHFKDFLADSARDWAEVGWVARCAYMDREALEARFGEVAEEVTLDYCPKGDEEKKPADNYRKAKVWEVWDKRKKQVYWLSKGFPEHFLDAKADPYKLKRFFPCPRPAWFVTTDDSIVPIPETAIWGDLQKEVDYIYYKIAEITKALNVVGVYDASQDAISRLLQETANGRMIPVENWMALKQSGGANAAFEMLDVKGMVEVLARLYDSLEQRKKAIYEIGGTSDILRGVSNPSETATAQEIKNDFATLRIRERQSEFARMIRDLYRIIGELILEHFQPQTIYDMLGVGFMSPDDQQIFPQAYEILKSDNGRTFRLDLETDTTVAVDRDAEQQRRVQYADSIANALSKLIPLMQQTPQVAGFVTTLISYVSRGMGAGRSVEGALENALQQLGQPQPAQNQQADQQAAQQADSQAAQQKAMLEAQKVQIQAQKANQEMALKTRKLETDIAFRAKEIEADNLLSAMELENRQKLEVAKIAAKSAGPFSYNPGV
jgi:hypothetical protein